MKSDGNGSRRDEENARREEYNRRQIEILQSLVQGIQLQGEAVGKRAEGQKDVKVQKLTEEDDIVAYIATFERLMIAYEVKDDRWVFKLASNLVGKAQQAYASLNAEDASDYDTMVHQSFVSEDKIQDGEAVAIRCAHGDTVLYPIARISLEVEGKPIEVEAAVSETLPISVVLGIDTPELTELLQSESKKENSDALAVITRATEERKKAEEEESLRREMMCGVKPNSIDASESKLTQVQTTEEENWLEKLDESLFTEGKERQKKSRREKRMEKKRRFQLEAEPEDDPGEDEAKELEKKSEIQKHELDITTDELKNLQALDPTLGEIRSVVKVCESTEGVGFFYQDGLLYKHWIPLHHQRGLASKREKRNMTVEQLVLPKKCRRKVMEMAHSIPLAGHLGKKKTTDRVLQRFIAEWCRTCDSCQKTSSCGVNRAPLIPLPIISQPFKRIAMDIVGSLPRSRQGNRFVLVICDYAARYPEAVPMKNVDAGSVAEELIEVFSRVGVPQEILTDQGTNFTSKLLTELYKMLHVQPIRTTPYHPQTDGLVECFNQTLKMMLRKTVMKEGLDWDKMLPYILFAYRKVPQASTGFSPFELLYGHQVRGPLDILKESWESNNKGEESVVSHILLVRDNLEQMKELVN